MSPLKPKFLLGAAFALMGLPHSYGMESASTHEQSPSDFSAAFTHFAEDKDVINECLESIKEAELHFFWTTGRTLSDNPEYHPDTQVNVSGADYGHKFFTYVGELLKNSADKLKVKFVCDQMTHASNKEQISALQAQYGDRFEILPIQQVEEKLLQAFPAQNKKVKMIFKKIK